MASSKLRTAKKNRNARIGLFGGTFDPPHIGHLLIAQQALVQLKLDRIIFIPAYTPPHKRKDSSTKPADRLTMVRLAVRGVSQFRVSDIEIRREGVSYTVDTVKEMQRRNPEADLFLIIGADNYAEFSRWKSYGEIVKIVKLVVYARSHKRVKKTLRGSTSKVQWLHGTLLEVSSSEIRNAFRRKQSIRYLVPAPVERYITSKKIYQHS